MAVRPIAKQNAPIGRSNKDLALELVTAALESGALTFPPAPSESGQATLGRAQADGAYLAQLFYATVNRLDRLEESKE